MVNLRRNAVSSAESRYTYFSQIPASTIQCNPTQYNPGPTQNFDLPPATPSCSGSANGEWKNRNVCYF